MRKTRKRRYRLWLLASLVLDLSAVGFLGAWKPGRGLPDGYFAKKENTQDLEETLAQVTPADQKLVSLSGETVGIYLATKGVLVIDTGEILTQEGSRQIPAKDLVQSGDYIVAFNEQQVTTKRDLMEKLKNLDGGEVTLEVLRNGKICSIPLVPVRDAAGDYKLGIWVRDDTQGIGTLTYVDEDGHFGALGHGISDSDTGGLLSIQNGALYRAQIISILKGSKGNPGELAGMIRYDEKERLGTIEKNTENGIYGTLNTPDGGKKLTTQVYPAAAIQEVVEGPAQILCHVGNSSRMYDAEITHIDRNHEDSNKSFVIHVTDDELLEQTGGIIQGLSGSPVIQNDKFVGAVTHVFVQDATTGYGIFAETMLKEQAV